MNFAVNDVVDTSKRYVLVRNVRDDGYIEFDFSLGEPEIFLEMILSTSAFNEFCQDNEVIRITEDDLSGQSTAEQVWRLSESSGQQFNNS